MVLMANLLFVAPLLGYECKTCNQRYGTILSSGCPGHRVFCNSVVCHRANTNPINISAAPTFAIVNIFCGFHQIAIRMQLRVLPGDNLVTHNSALLIMRVCACVCGALRHDCAGLCSCLCVLASCLATWSFLSIALASALQTPAGVVGRVVYASA